MFTQLLAFGWVMLLVLFGLGAIIGLHELGHYLGLKAIGAAVRQFAIGMGPKIWSCWFRETEFSLHIFPIGGFVRPVGESADGRSMENIRKDIEKAPTPETRAYLADPKRRVTNKSPAQRLVYLLGGPAFSMFGAMPLLMLSFALHGTAGPSKPARIGTLDKGSKAEEIGVQIGDLLVAVNGTAVEDSEAALAALHNATGETVLAFRRGDENYIRTVIPALEQGQPRFGVHFDTDIISLSVGEAVRKGFLNTLRVATDQFKGIYGLLSGQRSSEDFEGPVGIIALLGNSASAGFGPLFRLCCILSIAIGAFNLFPILPLDGGQAVLALVELLHRRKISERLLIGYACVSFALILVLIAFVVIGDIAKRLP